VQYALNLSQRWRDQRSVFTPPDTIFNPGQHGIEPITRSMASNLLKEHHYLGTCPVITQGYGLWCKDGVNPARLVGCGIFGMPASCVIIS
jgi:hypothetical protein